MTVGHTESGQSPHSESLEGTGSARHEAAGLRQLVEDQTRQLDALPQRVQKIRDGCGGARERFGTICSPRIWTSVSG